MPSVGVPPFPPEAPAPPPGPAVMRLGDGMALAAADGHDLLPGGARPRAILALLALAPGHRMPRRLLAGLLWSGAAGPQALARLRDVLHDLRASLGPGHDAMLRADAGAIWLDPGRVRVETAARQDGWPFLPELRGIDPQLDDWLAQSEGGAPRPATPPEARGAAARAPAAARRPGVLVVPFGNLAGPAVGTLDVATTDAVIAALSALRSVAVLVEVPGARATAPDYMLSGNIHLAGRRPQVALRLVDVAGGGAVLWSAVIEPEEPRAADLAGEVAALACARLEHELLLLEAERAAARPLTEASAQEMVMRVLPDLHRLERDAFERAGKVLALAVRRDPHCASAQAWLAYWNVLMVGQGWTANERETLAAAGAAAEQAILLDPRDARGLAIAGHVRGFLHHQVPEAIALCQRALEVNPSLPAAWTFAGMAHAYAGELEAARRHLRRALALLPRNPHAFFTEAGLATVEMLLGNHEAASEIGRRVLQVQPRFTAALRARIAALGHLGRAEEARPLVRALLELDPGFTVQRFRQAAPYRRRQEMDHFLRGLRAAGVG